MNRDDLFIDFLPEEYRPKPEWRSFPLVAAVILLVVGLGVFLNYSQLEGRKNLLAGDLKAKQDNLEIQKKQAVEFLPIQGKARVLKKYMTDILILRMANPPWWQAYNRVEEVLPEGVWIQNLRFTPSKKGWPGISMTVIAAGVSYSPLYNLHINLLSTPEFTNVRTTGYSKAQIDGQWVLSSNFTFSLDKKYFIEVPMPEAKQTQEG